MKSKQVHIAKVSAILLSIWLVLMGSAAYYTVRTTSPATETEDQQYAAFEQFHKWCQNPKNNASICITWREDGNSPWTARVYHVGRDGSITEWEESGYPRLMWAVRAVEFEHMIDSNGHIGKF